MLVVAGCGSVVGGRSTLFELNLFMLGRFFKEKARATYQLLRKQLRQYARKSYHVFKQDARNQ
jgi:hypothetical protein